LSLMLAYIHPAPVELRNLDDLLTRTYRAQRLGRGRNLCLPAEDGNLRLRVLDERMLLELITAGIHSIGAGR